MTPHGVTVPTTMDREIPTKAGKVDTWAEVISPAGFTSTAESGGPVKLKTNDWFPPDSMRIRFRSIAEFALRSSVMRAEVSSDEF